LEFLVTLLFFPAPIPPVVAFPDVSLGDLLFAEVLNYRLLPALFFGGGTDTFFYSLFC
jgi:hypothetical protein